MKILRSTILNLNRADKAKLDILSKVQDEYSKIVNLFIGLFWEKTPTKSELLKRVLDQVADQTWISIAMRQVGAREAIDLIAASKNRDGDKAKKPIHSGNRCQWSANVAEIQKPKGATHHNLWLHLRNIGRHIILDLPINIHKHYKKWERKGTLLRSFTMIRGKKGPRLQVCFEIETGPKKTEGKSMGIDTGIKILAAVFDGSKGKKYGQEIEANIHQINRAKSGSKRQKSLRRSLKQFMDKTAKQIVGDNTKLVVVETLRGLGCKVKQRRRLCLNMRRVLGTWAWKHWLSRIQAASEVGRATFRSVSPRNTSITCPVCGHAEKGNRTTQEIFRCLSCGYKGCADLTAARNILDRFLSGPYGAGFKPKDCVKARWEGTLGGLKPEMVMPSTVT